MNSALGGSKLRWRSACGRPCASCSSLRAHRRSISARSSVVSIGEHFTKRRFSAIIARNRLIQTRTQKPGTEMATPAPTLSLKEVLRLKPVRQLWAAQVVSIFGDFLAIFAIYSVASFRMHATATEISLILVSFLLPLAIVGPVAGVFVDRWNVKRTMIASDLTRAVLAALLVNATDIREIYVILFALSSVSSFFIPAQSVTLRTIVPHAGLMSANALMQNAIQLMQIISPAIAGVLVASVSAKVCFWLDSLSFIFSASMVYTLTIDREPSRKPLNLSIVIAEMNAGMKFIFTHSAVSFVILSLMAGMFVIRCFFALLAVY